MVSTSARVGSINVLLSTQLGPGVAGLNAFAGAVERTGAGVSRSVAGMDRSISGLNRSLGGINTRGMTSLTLGALRAGTAINQLQGIALAAGVAVGGLFPAAIAASLIRTVDGAHRLSNQLRTVTKDAEDLKSTQQALFEVAQRTRSSFDGAVTIYARTARATEHLRMTQANLLRMTETVQKAFAVGGATTQEAWGGAIQLSQGIASNRFSGDEFRSVAENAPVLLQGMANSLGVTIGKLREMAHAGELTAATVTKAILDASAEIDEAFAKTTSTIEQAWTRVGNAVTKYAMDSENAAAGSRAIVGGLNLVADNVSGLVEIIVALGAALTATFAARRMQAMTGWVSGLKAARIEALAAAHANQSLAQAQMQAARSDFLQKRLAFNAAMKQGALTAKQLERQKKALAASSVTYRTTTQAATAATTQLSVAQRAAAASGMTMAVAGRAVSAAWAFIGGPMGAAMLAIGGIMYINAQRAAEAQERSERYAEAIRKAGESSGAAAISIAEAAKSLRMVAEAATEAERILNLQQAIADLDTFMKQLAGTMTGIGLREGFQSDIYVAVDELRKKFAEGEISAEELRKGIDDIATANPDIADILVMFQTIAGQAAAAKGVIDALRESIGSIGDVQTTPKTSRIGAPEPLSDTDFASRTGWDEYFKFPKPKKEPKGSAPKKTADDRFDNSVQAIYDRIEALRLEREMLGATYYEQVKREEALKLEQEALKQAREEARKKGDADWQNAQISAEKRAEIDKVSAALAAEADATRRATEAMELQKSVMKDVLSGLREALADGKLTWEEIGQVAIRVLDKIINKIEDELIDSIFRMNSFGGGWAIPGVEMAGKSSGSGVIASALSFIPKLLGFEPGGYTGDGPAGQVAGLVHAGEYIFNKKAVRQIGVENLEALHEIASNGFASGGYAGAVAGRIASAVGGLRDGGRDVRVVVSVDDEGALRAYVTRQSGRVASAVISAAAPSIAEQGASMAEGNLRSGRSDGAMSRFGVAAQPRRR